VNVHERAARQRKCARLLRVIDALESPPPALEVSWWDDGVWEKLAKVAGVKIPSATTRRWVVDELRMREELDSDPFAVFDVKETG
jgi:hypothetical protein